MRTEYKGKIKTRYCDLSAFENKIDVGPKFYTYQPDDHVGYVRVHLYNVDYSYIISCVCKLSDFRMLRKLKTNLYSFEQVYDRLPF